jgi:hypothetical protein
MQHAVQLFCINAPGYLGVRDLSAIQQRGPQRRKRGGVLVDARTLRKPPGTHLVGCTQSFDRASRHEHHSVVMQLLSIEDACGTQQDLLLLRRGLSDYRSDSRMLRGRCWPGSIDKRQQCNAGIEEYDSTACPDSCAQALTP